MANINTTPYITTSFEKKPDTLEFRAGVSVKLAFCVKIHKLRMLGNSSFGKKIGIGCLGRLFRLNGRAIGEAVEVCGRVQAVKIFCRRDTPPKLLV